MPGRIYIYYIYNNTTPKQELYFQIQNWIAISLFLTRDRNIYFVSNKTYAGTYWDCLFFLQIIYILNFAWCTKYCQNAATSIKTIFLKLLDLSAQKQFHQLAQHTCWLGRHFHQTGSLNNSLAARCILRLAVKKC